MNLFKYNKVWDSDVERWLINSIPELTAYQKQCIRDDEIVRNSGYIIMEEAAKKTNNVFIRLSIVFVGPVLLLLYLGMPFNYIITGRWGYGYVNWVVKWLRAVGF